MQTYYVIVNKSGGYRFEDEKPFLTDLIPSTYVVNDEAEIYVYWPGRTSAEMTNADKLVIPVHEMLMDVALGRKGKTKTS